MISSAKNVKYVNDSSSDPGSGTRSNVIDTSNMSSQEYYEFMKQNAINNGTYGTGLNRSKNYNEDTPIMDKMIYDSDKNPMAFLEYMFKTSSGMTPEEFYKEYANYGVRKQNWINEYLNPTENDLWSGSAPSSGRVVDGAKEMIDRAKEIFGTKEDNTSAFSSVGSSIGSGLDNIAGSMTEGFQGYIDMMKQLSAENNAWSAEQAQKQMDFQERMARNAHTYEVEDLKRAGLNPVLSAGAGSGAAAPNGASATAENNTSAIAQLAMMALETVQSQSSAMAVNSVKHDKGLFGFLSDKKTTQTISNLAKVASIASTTARLFGI